MSIVAMQDVKISSCVDSCPYTSGYLQNVFILRACYGCIKVCNSCARHTCSAVNRLMNLETSTKTVKFIYHGPNVRVLGWGFGSYSEMHQIFKSSPLSLNGQQRNFVHINTCSPYKMSKIGITNYVSLLKLQNPTLSYTDFRSSYLTLGLPITRWCVMIVNQIHLTKVKIRTIDIFAQAIHAPWQCSYIRSSDSTHKDSDVDIKSFKRLP